MITAIVRWSLRRPRLALYLAACFLIFGGLYVGGSRLDIFPDLAPARAVIQTEAPGLVPGQVEQLVTRPIENVVVGSAGVAAVHSDSVQGLSMVTVDFSKGADPRLSLQAVAARLGQIAGQLPAGVGAPRTWPLTSGTGEILKVGFTSDRLSPMALRSLVQWVVRPRLMSTAGVARVSSRVLTPNWPVTPTSTPGRPMTSASPASSASTPWTRPGRWIRPWRR